MIKLKNILLEKKELGPKFIQNIKSLTNRNNHTEARIELAKAVGDKRLLLFYESMLNLNKVFQGYPGELQKLMKKMENQLYKSIKRSYANAEEIIGLL
jgi:hypothetical protein